MNLIALTPDRPLCIACNKNYSAKTGRPKADGTRYFAKKCNQCRHEAVHGSRHPFKLYKIYSKPYREHKKTYCEACGFVAKYAVQLDVDHINGDHKNNDLSNLQTLCSNCHRAKTWENKEHGRRAT